jgi:magnesium-transporting ATPase (P-type)
VAIYTPHQEDINKRWNSSKDDSRVFPKRKRTRLFIHNFYRGFFSFMSFLFSDVHANRSKGQVTFCHVLVDRERHVRYFVFRLRRYVFHEDTSMFIPISINVGLSTTEAQDRHFLLGPNALDLPKPSYLQNVQREFNKTFYIYQLFIIWAWCPLYSYFMACVQATIIAIGGLTVSLFLYRNETNTYRCTRIAGDIPIVRNGSIHVHSIRDLVPGDVVQVTTGRVAADMVLIEGHEIIVDETALTGESTPMVKRAIDLSDSHSRYNTTVHKRYTLSAGTTVMASENAKALVLKTGS